MKQADNIQLYPAGRQVKMGAGWNHASNSLVGRVGTVVAYKPFSVFEKEDRNKVVFPDGSYVICDRDYLRPLMRDLIAEKLAGIRMTAVRTFNAIGRIQSRFRSRIGG
ncbi:hypothetical protein [Paenibacillus sp. 2TAB26]|uniref:hypothetical protein n=1 Tax=Paenibacillus sp. 2TAB26 TaxID=3233005 RepID=UPI003F999C4D